MNTGGEGKASWFRFMEHDVEFIKEGQIQSGLAGDVTKPRRTIGMARSNTDCVLSFFFFFGVSLIL